MKKLITLLLALFMIVSLTACGGSEEKAEETPKNPEDVTGETYDAGNVNALVPKGWKAFSVMDMWSDDPNATDPDQVNIVKGGETELDLLSKPYIQIVHYEPGSMFTPSKDFYEEAVDVEPITAGDLTWEGFSAKSLLGSSITIIWTTNADGHQFQLNLYTEASGGSFALTDADVLAVLASIKNSK